MIKQFIVLIFGLTTLFNQGNGQTFKEQFDKIYFTNDTVGQRKILEEWEKSDSDKTELYTSYFTYYIGRGIRTYLLFEYSFQMKEGRLIMVRDTSEKEPLPFLYAGTYYDTYFINKGFSYIDKGIKKYPDRLDFRFGKIFMLGEIDSFEKFTTEIIQTIEYSSANNTKWVWSNNIPLDDQKEFMLSSIQNFQTTLYNTENDSLLDNIKRIAETILKYYPDHIESLMDLSKFYSHFKKYDKAIEALLTVEKMNPKDYNVLYNIAKAYKLKGDNKNAKIYYELTLEYGRGELQEFAKIQIDELNKE